MQSRTTLALTAALALPLALAACGESEQGPQANRSTTPETPTITDAGDAASAAITDATLRFSVTGMHCEACVNAVTAKLAAMPGVESVHVSLEDEQATVQCQSPDAVKPDAIVQAINALEYEAELVTQRQ